MTKPLLFLVVILYIPYLQAQSPFITTWKTNNPGTSADNQITIPTFEGELYDYTVNWGDGTSNTNVSGDITHTYVSPGTYTVQIEGVFPRIYFEDFQNSKDSDKIIAINQWGSIDWSSMAGAFSGCRNLDVGATDLPNLSNVNDLSKMFDGCIALEANETMANWDTSNAREFSQMFRGAAQFNQPIGSWNMSGAVNMHEMFREATAFNQDLGAWEMGQAVYLSYMFYQTNFNHDIGSWDVSNVTHFDLMFGNNSEFNQDISSWNVSAAWHLGGMFRGATSFNQDIGSWNVANVIYMFEMFSGAASFDQNLGNWDISNASHVYSMFNNSGLSVANYDLTLIGWNKLPNLKKGLRFDAVGVQYCEGGEARRNIAIIYDWEITDGGITSDCQASQQRPFITSWNVNDPNLAPDYVITIPVHATEQYDYSIDWGDGTTDIGVTGSISHAYNSPGTYKITIRGIFPRIFFGAENTDSMLISSIDQWGDIEWTSMESAFSDCTNLNIVAKDIPNLSLVTSATEMFKNCSSLIGNYNFNKWDVSSLKTVNEMFAGATLFNQSLSKWSTSGFTEMSRMFFDSGFDKSLGNWDVSNVTTMSEILSGSKLTTVNYDNTLIGWSQLSALQPGIQFDGGASEYCIGSGARQQLIDVYGWTVTDAGENCPTQRPFVTTWKTDNLGDSDDSSISFPVAGGPYTVDWGDGMVEPGLYGIIEHAYDVPGVYTVSITGNVYSVSFNGTDGNPGQNDNNKLVEINQWGDIQWLSFSGAFGGCKNMDVIARDTPDLSSVSSLFSMFHGCNSLKGNNSFNNWDLRSVNNLIQVFSGCYEFNAEISDWDVSNVNNMQNLFAHCWSFNRDLSGWDVSNVTNMWSMFSDATVFDQDISEWNTSNVTNMTAMFQSSGFNQDISDWDVSNVTDMSYMFNLTPKFNQPIGKWDVSNVVNMSRMLSSTAVFDQDLSNWNVSSVENMNGMFAVSGKFNQDISNWDVSSVTDMSSLFVRAFAFDQDLGSWDVSAVKEMNDMFSYSRLSAENYDNTLLGWANLPTLQRAVNLGALNIRYCQSELARLGLIENYRWVISDAGKIPLCDEDGDGDGVMDHLDRCLYTAPGVPVDSNGCDHMPSDVLSVLGQSPSCPGGDDGTIEISLAKDGYMMDITIQGEDLDTRIDDIPSSQGFRFPVLSAGIYTVVVAIPEINYEQSFGITLQEPGMLTGKRTGFDDKGVVSVTYEVSGSKQYRVWVNDKEINYEFEDDHYNTIQLDDLGEYNEIKIYGARDCQGIIEDHFFMGEIFMLSATIVDDHLSLISGETPIEISIYSLDGRLIERMKPLEMYGSPETIDISSLNSGIYLVHLITNEREKAVKILKR